MSVIQKRYDSPSCASPCVTASPLILSTHPPEQNRPPLLLTTVTTSTYETVGYYADANGVIHGFVERHGQFTTQEES